MGPNQRFNPKLNDRNSQTKREGSYIHGVKLEYLLCMYPHSLHQEAKRSNQFNQVISQ